MTFNLEIVAPISASAWNTAFRRFGALTVAVALWGCTGGGSAPWSDDSPLVPKCIDCTLSFTPIVSIGDKGEPDLVPDWPVFAFDGRQTLLVSDERDAVQVFGADGLLLASLGSPGDGPGELRGVDGASWGESGSFVVHRSDGRLIEFGGDGAGLDRARIDPGCRLESTSFPVVCVGEGGPDVQSPLVRVLGANGESLFDFVPKPGRVQEDRCVMCRALIATAGNGLLWAVSGRFHRVELWDSGGSVRVSVDLTGMLEQIISDSLGQDERGRIRTRAAVSLPSIGGVAIIDAFISERDRITTPVVAEVNGVRVQSEAMTKLMQVRPLASIISVVDTAGNLIAAQFFRGRSLTAAGGEFVAELRESTEGLPVLVLGTLRIRR